MAYTYSAFISYRHLPADIEAAKAVQRALETYRIPADIRRKTGVKKLKRCFRDQDELPLADDLGASIEKALQESEWLVVICSPDLPASAWCLREVDYFIGLGRRDHIIPVLISGEPKDSYPPQITHEETEEKTREVEPLAADVRGRLKKQLKTEKMRIIARMLNLNYNDLKKREKEQALRRGLALVSCVLAVAVGFAVYALYKNRLLTEERNATARNATELLIEKSVRSTRDGDRTDGLAYAVQAYDGSRIFDAEYDPAITAAIEAAIYPEICSQIGRLKDNGVIHGSASLSNDGRRVTFRQADNSLPVYDTVTGEKLFSIRNFGRYWDYAFSPDGRYLFKAVTGYPDYTVYSGADGTETLTGTLPEGWRISDGRLTLDNRIAAERMEDHAAGLFNPFTGEMCLLEGVALSGGPLDEVVIHREGRRGAWADGSRIWIVDTESGAVLRTMEGSLFSIYTDVTDEGPYFRYMEGDAYVYLRWDTGEEVLRSENEGVLSPDGKLLAAANGTEGFTVYDAASGEEVWTTGFNQSNTVYNLAFADNDILVASHSQVQIYRISRKRELYSTGEERAAYGFDLAAGRLVMPLRSGGALINQMPSEDENAMPHAIVESRESFNPEDLVETTTILPLAGNWEGSTFGFFDGEGNYITLEMDEPGLAYVFEGQGYMLHPTRGVTLPYVYISPDGEWQAMLRGQEVDVFRAKEGPEPVMTIPGNNFDRRCLAIYGNMMAAGSYVENLSLFDLTTGECMRTLETGAMCDKIQFSADGKHIIAFSGLNEQASVISTENWEIIMKFTMPGTAMTGVQNYRVGFSRDGSEAIVLYPDGSAETGLLYQDLDTLVEKARKYTAAE